MSSFKCGECSQAAAAYCVECKKVLCRRCVGRLHVPECPKANKHSIERLDVTHQDVQHITNFIMNAMIAAVLVWTVLKFPINKEYIKMEQICPVLGQGRWWLAYWDVNVYYYFKTSISTYCDVEDSFWRLLMDGWVRGVVTSSDSLLILLSTLPKAMLFKVAIVTLLMPVLGCIYGVLAFVVMQVVIRFEDGLHDAADFFNDSLEPCKQSAIGKRVIKCFKFMVNAPNKLSKWISSMQESRSLAINSVRMIFMSFGLAGVLRLVVRYVGLRITPGLWTKLAPNANIWQLMFEPVVYFYIAYTLQWLDKKISKYFPNKKAVAASTPLTVMRDRPAQDPMEWIDYRWQRVSRNFGYYKKQAEGLLKVVVNDVFNGVIVARLVCILLPSIAAGLRTVLASAGLGELLARHGDQFYEATGFRQGEDNMYLSDRALSLSYWLGVRQIGGVSTGTIFEVDFASVAWESMWRVLAPVAMYVVYSRWQAFMENQKKSFEKAWEGSKGEAAWKDGSYKACLDEYSGVYWSTVDAASWTPMPPKAKTNRPALFTAERRASRSFSKETLNLAPKQCDEHPAVISVAGKSI